MHHDLTTNPTRHRRSTTQVGLHRFTAYVKVLWHAEHRPMRPLDPANVSAVTVSIVNIKDNSIGHRYRI